MVAAPQPRPGRPLGFGDWPAADRRAWDRALRAGDPFTDAGGGAHWRPATRDGYQAAYGRWLAFLARRGWLDPNAAPAERLKQAWVVTYVTELQARIKPISVWSYLSDLHNTVFRMIPEADWSWLRDIVNRLHWRMPSTNVTASDLLPIGEIYDRGLALMEAAERDPPARPLHDSVCYRDGLMLAFAAGTLLRSRNLAGLRIGVSLLETSEGYVLDIPAEEVKNRQPIEGPLPASLTPYLTRYLDHHRPRLLQGNRSEFLWISIEDRPMKVHQVGQRVARLTEQHLGKRVPLQRFRHCAATTIASASPELTRIIRPLLAHTTNRTAERYYNRARMIDAGRRHAAALSGLKKQLQDAEETAS